MKNAEDGFIVPLVMVVAFFVALGGAYVYENRDNKISTPTSNTVELGTVSTTSKTNIKTTTPDASSNTSNRPSSNTTLTVASHTFTHSSGAFSFRYPPNFDIVEDDYLLKVMDKNSIAEVARLHVSFIFEPLLVAITQKSAVKSILPNGKEIYTVTDSEFLNDSHTIVYKVIVFDSEYNATLSASAQSLGLGKFTREQFDAMLNSITVDDKKVQELVQASKDKVAHDEVERPIRANLSYVQTSAEIYYYNAPDNFARICNPDLVVEGGRDVAQYLKLVIDGVGKKNFVCFADQAGFALSVKMPTGTVWCVDSYNFNSSISQMVTKSKCK